MDERTEEILMGFITSWTETESFYDNHIDNYPGFERLKPFRQFIRILK